MRKRGKGKRLSYRHIPAYAAASAALAAELLFHLTACADETSDRKSGEDTFLSGEWEQPHGEDDALWQSAVVDGSGIEVYWNGAGYKGKELYWAGSVDAQTDEPAEDGVFSWDSEKDAARVRFQLTASSKDSKRFTYKNGELSYDVSVAGTERTLRLYRVTGEAGGAAPFSRQERTGEAKDKAAQAAAKTERKEAAKEEPLRIKESAFFMNDTGNVNFALVLENPNTNLRPKDMPVVSATMYAANGTILGTEEIYCPYVQPNDTVNLWGISLSGVKPERVEFALQTKGFTEAGEGEGARTDDFEIGNVTVRKSMHTLQVTGELTSRFPKPVSEVWVTAFFRKDGKIVGAGTEYISGGAQPEGKRAFDFHAYYEKGLDGYDTVEIQAMDGHWPW